MEQILSSNFNWRKVSITIISAMHLSSSIQNTLQVLQHYRLAETVACWLWHQVTHLKRETNRKNESSVSLSLSIYIDILFSPLAIAYLFCSHEPDAIFVRSVNEMEVKPKPKVLP